MCTCVDMGHVHVHIRVSAPGAGGGLRRGWILGYCGQSTHLLPPKPSGCSRCPSSQEVIFFLGAADSGPSGLGWGGALGLGVRVRKGVRIGASVGAKVRVRVGARARA